MSASGAHTVKRLDVVDLGVLSYRDAYARQQRLVDAVHAGGAPDTLLLVEHPHVYTLGRNREAVGNVLAAGDVEVVQVERGGDVTYHGPGQLVAYPIIQLGEAERDLHAFMRHLEGAIIATVARAGLVAGRSEGNTGVWLDGRKVASIGIACRRWVTWHGLALNVSTDLSYFQRINPCGFEASVMTSLAAEIGERAPGMGQVKTWLGEEVAGALGRSLASD